MKVTTMGAGDDMSAEPDHFTENDGVLLAQALAPLAPPPDVQARVLARVRKRIDEGSGPPTHESRSTLRTLRRSEGAWRPMAPNVDVRVLHDDGSFASMLIRMQPGACLPPHSHRGDEECYVLSGDIWLSGVHLRTGDFQFASTDVIHDDIRSEDGCLLHIRAPSGAVAD